MKLILTNIILVDFYVPACPKKEIKLPKEIKT